MQDAAQKFLDALPVDLAPLADAARALLNQPGDVSEDGVLRLGHRPWVAPENYAMFLYPGLPVEALTAYAARYGLIVPEIYIRFLTAINGAFCFGMSLAGVPASMLGSPPLLDRQRLQCHNLGSAATLWATEYRKLSPGAFHLGSRNYSRRENVGYFVTGNRIVSLRKSGKVVGEWDGLSDFLRDELRASAALDLELHPPGGQ